MVEEVELKNSDELIKIDENFKLTAGPGSGKTRFLINHIHNVINNSTKLKNGRKIACITHTNVAVDEIKKRLESSVNEVETTTIHSFLYKHVVKPYLWTVATEFGLNINSLHLIKEAIPSYSLLPTKLKWMVKDKKTQTLYSLLKKIKWIYEDGELKLKIDENKLPNSYLKEYKKKCWEKNLLTPDDILFFSYHILNKHSKIGEILNIKYPYIFLDEFQDTSSLQSEIIKLLLKTGTIIGIIGDYAQSIYKFQGADVSSFLNFDNNAKFNKYILKNNHRSNETIVNILNHIRQDNFKQKCCKPKNKQTIPPTILVGKNIIAYKYTEKALSHNTFYSLSYKSFHIKDLKFELEHENEISYIDWKEMDNIFETDSNYHRQKIIHYTILAIESFRNKNIKDSIKFMKFAYKEYFDDNYTILMNLFQLNSKYDEFINLSITEFYNNYIHNIIKKHKINSAKVREYYDKYEYIDFALNLDKSNDSTKFRTIHSCKGEEFVTVALFLKSENDLEFLLNPNINNETHRIYYVALSRAEENIVINVPKLNKNKKNTLKKIGFNVVYLNELDYKPQMEIL